MPYAARVVTSQRLRYWRQWPARAKAKWSSELPCIQFFHQFDDPYSALALEMVSHLSKHYQVNVEVHVVNVDGYHAKQTQGWQRYRLMDARRLAQAWSFEPSVLAKLPKADDINLCSRSLASVPRSQRNSTIVEMTRALWQGQIAVLRDLPHRFDQSSERNVEQQIERAHRLREKLGHYQSATWYFEGTWYWGLDRLEYLEDDLSRWGLACTDGTVQSEHFVPKRVPALDASVLDIFFSFRSPYSYLAVARLEELRRATDGSLAFRFRPVLPMVQRGVQLSPHKRAYILNDVARIAKKNQIPFGYICDPLGPGINKLLALFYHAREQRLEHRFVFNVMQAIWSVGADVSSHRVLEKLCERSGLPWVDAKHHLESSQSLLQADKNQQQLDLMGLWGVPTFALTDSNNRLSTVFWGQDRLPWIEYGLAQSAQ